MTTTEIAVKQFKTTDRRLKGQPLEQGAYGVMIKPGELIDIIEITALTLSDYRTFNLLLANAWDNITDPTVHRIRKTTIKGAHQSNDRIDASIDKLMQAVAKVRVTKDGEPAILKVQLLSSNVEHERSDGYFYYRFPEELIAIITQSTIFARLEAHVMSCFTSKYALRLYEIMQKRVNLTYTQTETFSVEAFRDLIGVPKGKLKSFGEFKRYALNPAIREVNAYSNYFVSITPKKTGRKVTHLIVVWLKKAPQDALTTMQEVDRHSAGRRARLDDTVQTITP